MKKIITKKQKDCSGCLFKHINDIHCEMAFKITGIDCATEDIIFVHEEEPKEPKYRACRNIDEGSMFIDKHVKDNKGRTYLVMGVRDDGFIITPDGQTYDYHFWCRALEEYTLEDGSPIGVKEEQ